MAHGFEQPAHDAVTAFAQHHPIPAIRPGAARLLARLDTRLAVFQFHASFQGGTLLGRHLAARAHGILPLQLRARVGESVGQVPRGREEEQTSGIEIQATDVEPAGAARRR
jgi:hypothetical protein